MLEDIAILTGGEVISEDLALDLKETKIEQLGRAHQVVVQKENTIIVDSLGDKEQIKNRVAQIRTQIEETTSEFDKEKLQERLAKLSGGVAVIKVGAATETEMKEKKLRIEDALAATRAAVEEGIVAGGGTAFINAIPAVEKLLADVTGDEKTGVQIILKALEEPVKQIAKNAGLEGSVIVEKVKDSKPGIGYNALIDEYQDMVKAGIVDPTKVTSFGIAERSKRCFNDSDNGERCCGYPRTRTGYACRRCTRNGRHVLINNFGGVDFSAPFFIFTKNADISGFFENLNVIL